MNDATHVLAPFGWPVVLYLTLAGVAAGAALAAVWALFAGAPRWRAWGERGLLLAAAAIALGGAFLIADLEAPGRFGLILTHFNPASAIAWGARIITLFGILTAFIWLVLRRGAPGRTPGRTPGRPLGPGLRLGLGAIALLALAIGLYPGWVLFQAAARPLWGSVWIAPLFLVSALHTGLAALLLWQALRPAPDAAADRAAAGATAPGGARLELFLVLGQAVLLALYFLTLSGDYGAARERLLHGELAPWLWGGVVLAGWLLPLASLAGESAGRGRSALRATSILLGGLALRALIVLGGQGSEALLAAVR